MKPIPFDFYTAYNQFYIADQDSIAATGDDFWTDKAISDYIAVARDLLAPQTGSYGHIKGELFVLEQENIGLTLEKFDHVVEAGINVNSGVIQFWDCPNSSIELRVNLSPGHYRVRVCSANLSTTDIDEDEGNDYYIIEIWKNDDKSVKVLKRFVPSWKR